MRIGRGWHERTWFSFAYSKSLRTLSPVRTPAFWRGTGGEGEGEGGYEIWKGSGTYRNDVENTHDGLAEAKREDVEVKKRTETREKRRKRGEETERIDDAHIGRPISAGRDAQCRLRLPPLARPFSPSSKTSEGVRTLSVRRWR